MTVRNYQVMNAAHEITDLVNHLFLLTFDNHQCLCPKDAGAKRVLDIGTGTGIWAIDYGVSTSHGLSKLNAGRPWVYTNSHYSRRPPGS